MAFDLYLGDERAFIDHNEEGIFYLVSEGSYPQLSRLWGSYYKSPPISYEAANDLVHELIHLRQEIGSGKSEAYLIRAIDRLLPLLSKAYKSKADIRTCSD